MIQNKNLKEIAFPLGVVGLFGLLMALLPSLYWYFKEGVIAWDTSLSDGIFWLNISSKSFYNHLFTVEKDSFFPWLQVIPATFFTKVFSPGPDWVMFWWRLWGGLSTSLAMFFLGTVILKDYWKAALFSLLFLTDSGLRGGSGLPVFSQLLDFFNWGGAFSFSEENFPKIFFKQWRLPTGLLGQSFLIIFSISLYYLKQKGEKLHILMTAVSLGLLFYVYFYYWTSAGLALGFLLLLDFRKLKKYLISGILGVLFGLPQILQNYFQKSTAHPDFFDRANFFVEIGRFSDLLIPKKALVLIFFILFWSYKWRREALPFVALIISGLLLSNHQVISKLNIQNFHFNYFVLSPFLGICLYWMLFDLYILIIHKNKSRERVVTSVGTACVIIFSCFGLSLRFQEGKHSDQGQNIISSVKSMRDEGFNLVDKVIAGEPRFLDFSMIYYNSIPIVGYPIRYSRSRSHGELDERTALNSYLEGKTHEEFRQEQIEFFKNYQWGKLGQDRKLIEKRIEDRLSIFNDIVNDPENMIRKFELTHLVLSKNSPPRVAIENSLEFVTSGNHYSLWRFK